MLEPIQHNAVFFRQCGFDSRRPITSFELRMLSDQVVQTAINMIRNQSRTTGDIGQLETSVKDAF